MIEISNSMSDKPTGAVDFIDNPKRKKHSQVILSALFDTLKEYRQLIHNGISMLRKC